MNIVETAARIINGSAWMEGWADQDGVAAVDHPLLHSRLAYQRAEATEKATEILKLALRMTADELREALIQAELDGWRSLGVPVDNADLADTVRRKYGSAAT